MLVEEEIRDRQAAERVRDRARVYLEASLAAGLRREQRRQQDYDQSATSTERIGGRLRATSVHLPSRERAKTEPLCIPR